MSGDSTNARAILRLANFRQPTDDEIQRGIDATMRDVVFRDARSNPNAMGTSALVTPAGAARVVSGPVGPGETNGVPNNWGWQAPAPLAPRPGQDIIERMVNAALPQPKPKPRLEGEPKEPNDDRRRKKGTV